MQFSATGMIAGSGYYHMAADQLDRFRERSTKMPPGAEIVAITDGLRQSGAWSSGRSPR